jgi:hypothetical protein
VKDEGDDGKSETLDSSRPSNGTSSSDPKKRNNSSSANNSAHSAKKSRLNSTEISHSSSPADLSNKHELLTDAELLSSEVVQLLQTQPHNNAVTTMTTTESSTVPPIAPPLDSVDDLCFVCGQEGQLLLCDYPKCKRVYHEVSTQPTPIDRILF